MEKKKYTPRLRIDISVYYHGKTVLKLKKVTLFKAKNILRDINKKYN